ncbi:MAG: hypothetical protein HZR80_05720 [Candidatus Heimdallarchaeota archaeon]
MRYYPDQPEGWYELARIQAYLGLFLTAQKTLYRCLEITNEYYLVAFLIYFILYSFIFSINYST